MDPKVQQQQCHQMATIHCFPLRLFAKIRLWGRTCGITCNCSFLPQNVKFGVFVLHKIHVDNMATIKHGPTTIWPQYHHGPRAA